MLTKLSTSIEHNPKRAKSNLERGIGKPPTLFWLGLRRFGRENSKSRRKWAACPMLSILKSTIILNVRRRQEPVATDYVYADVDDGSMRSL